MTENIQDWMEIRSTEQLFRPVADCSTLAAVTTNVKGTQKKKAVILRDPKKPCKGDVVLWGHITAS